MGCIESTFLTGKHRLSDKKSKRQQRQQQRQFQIPDIVIEEYMSCSVDNLNKSHSEDCVWLKDSDFNKRCPKTEWFVPDCDSVTAEYLLRDKGDGTFLVRESLRHKGHYVLTVTLHYFVHHLLIHNTEGGFGLMEAGIHPNLESLILHFSKVSLSTKNDILDTKLIKGVFQK